MQHGARTQTSQYSSREYTTDDILSGVNKLEAVIELDKYKPFQMQLSAAIGLAFDFFNHYQTYLLTQRRKKSQNSKKSVSSHIPMTVNIIPMMCSNETTKQTSTSEMIVNVCETPLDMIAKVCQSLQEMNHLIRTQHCNFQSFSSIISDLISSISQIIDMTDTLNTPTTTTTIQLPLSLSINSTLSKSIIYFPHISHLPSKMIPFFPPTDIIQQLMNSFGHFKNTTVTSSGGMDHNIVVLTGESGCGELSCLLDRSTSPLC